MNSIIDSLNGIIDSNYKSLDTIKRVNGTVTKSYPDIDSKIGYAKVVVKIVDFDNEIERLLMLPNKSGERLGVGDRVLIYYWNTITDGYVALKLGLSAAPYVKPDKSLSYGYTMTNDIKTIKKIATNVHYISFNPAFVPFDG